MGSRVPFTFLELYNAGSNTSTSNSENDSGLQGHDEYDDCSNFTGRDSSDVVVAFSYLLLVLTLGAFVILLPWYIYRRKKHVIRKRQHFMIAASVFGCAIQLTWVLYFTIQPDDLGRFYKLLPTLLGCIMLFQMLTPVLRLLQLLSNLSWTKRKAKFDLAKALAKDGIPDDHEIDLLNDSAPTVRRASVYVTPGGPGIALEGATTPLFIDELDSHPKIETIALKVGQIVNGYNELKKKSSRFNSSNSLGISEKEHFNDSKNKKSFSRMSVTRIISYGFDEDQQNECCYESKKINIARQYIARGILILLSIVLLPVLGTVFIDEEASNGSTENLCHLIRSNTSFRRTFSSIFAVFWIIMLLGLMLIYKQLRKPKGQFFRNFDPMKSFNEIKYTLLIELVLGPIIFGLILSDEVYLGVFLLIVANLMLLFLLLAYPIYLSYIQERITDSKQSRGTTNINRISLDDVLNKDPMMLILFKKFMIAEMTIENYLFWREIQNYKSTLGKIPLIQTIRLRKAITHVFLRDNAEFWVNVSGAAKAEFIAKVQDNKAPKIDDFDRLGNEVYTLLALECFHRFTQTKAYAQTIGSDSTDMV